jgi:sugar transferase (PEP-CTERM/EpsH1 system associated)
VKVLFVTPRFPWPPDRGDRMTAYALLRSLARTHEITLLSHVDGREPREALDALGRLGVRIETVPLPRTGSWARAWLGLLSPTPSQVAYYRSPAMHELATRHISEGGYDVVFVQLFRMAQAVRGAAHPAKVLFLADSIALNLEGAARFEPWWKRPVIAWERGRVEAYERAAAREFREAWVVSSVDRDHLRARGVTNARAVPHGVDPALFDLVPRRAPEPRVMFLGNLSVPHNVDAAIFAAREVFPDLRRLEPRAELWLVGAEPRPAVRALASLPGVTVTGSVPDLAPLWAAAHVLLAPLRFSSGIQNKVLEAMAAGVPVVTTPSAAAGLGEGAQGLVRVGEDARGLARESATLLADTSLAKGLAARARSHARLYYSWDALGKQLERVALEVRFPPVGH